MRVYILTGYDKRICEVWRVEHFDWLIGPNCMRESEKIKSVNLKYKDTYKCFKTTLYVLAEFLVLLLKNKLDNLIILE